MEELDGIIEELKDAFRIYDKEGQGFITTETLRELISELLAPLSKEELDGIVEELDEDGSGSMDFDEFCEMMMTKPEEACRMGRLRFLPTFYNTHTKPTF